MVVNQTTKKASEQLNSANVTLTFDMHCAAGTKQPYPVVKGAIPWLGLNSVGPS